MSAAVELLTPICTGSHPDLEQALAQAVLDAETAEQGLAIDHSRSNIEERVSTGSFYTPADVAEHFWGEYFRFHDISTKLALRHHLTEFTFIEPSIGAGIFLFSLMRMAVTCGCGPEVLASLRFIAIDLNRAALQFVAGRLRAIEVACGCRLGNITLHETDFCHFQWAGEKNVSFVGNPPYVKNKVGARWKNLYADFLSRMLDTPADRRNISLILPVSIAFSRDYSHLRDKIRCSNQAIRIESFDNIPDGLFTTGKPGSQNSNKANSQRCSILFLRRGGEALREASSMRRWSRKERAAFLKSKPDYVDISAYSLDGQFPRPSCDWIINYLGHRNGAISFGDLVSDGRQGFAVSPVGRNFVGLRDLTKPETSSTLLTFSIEAHMLWAIQILGSPIFYEYWRTVGDGFHITRSDILRFPIRPRLLEACIKGEARARSIWSRRAAFERWKMNCGKKVVSYDFRGQFDNLLDIVTSYDLACPATVPFNHAVLSFQPSFPGLLAT